MLTGASPKKLERGLPDSVSGRLCAGCDLALAAMILIEWFWAGRSGSSARLLAGMAAVMIPLIVVGMTLPPFLALRRGGLLRYAVTVISLPPLLVYLSLANTLPMITAFFGRRESFKRTPKPADRP